MSFLVIFYVNYIVIYQLSSHFYNYNMQKLIIEFDTNNLLLITMCLEMC